MRQTKDEPCVEQSSGKMPRAMDQQALCTGPLQKRVSRKAMAGKGSWLVGHQRCTTAHLR